MATNPQQHDDHHWQLLQRVVDALYRSESRNHEVIAELYDEIKKLGFLDSFKEQDIVQLELSQQLVSARKAFQDALDSHEVGRIAEVYSQHEQLLKDDTGIEQNIRQLVSLAQDFVKAYLLNNDDAIAIAHDKLFYSSFGIDVKYTPQENARIQQAAAHTYFQASLSNGIVSQIVKEYERFKNLLPQDTATSIVEKEQIRLASDFVQAYNNGTDSEIIKAVEAIRFSPHCQHFTFTPDEDTRISKARYRAKVKQSPTLATVNNTILISLRTFYEVRAVRERYIRVRIAQLQAKKSFSPPVRQLVLTYSHEMEPRPDISNEEFDQRFSDKTLQDIVYDMAILKNQMVNNPSNNQQIQEKLDILFEELRSWPERDFREFLNTYQLDEVAVKEALIIYVRFEVITLFRWKNKMNSLETWLPAQRVNVQIHYPDDLHTPLQQNRRNGNNGYPLGHQHKKNWLDWLKE